MKKILLILLLISTLLITYYLYSQSDKDKVEDFAIELVDDSIPLENVLKKRIKYSEKQKNLSLIVLKTIRDEYQENPKKIVVKSSSEYTKAAQEDKIKLYDGEHLFYIEFNKALTLPFVINKKSQIIILFHLTKGGGGDLNNSRSDDNAL
jgi:hypothetical protein